ncbi:uncharacterized protein LOC132193548 [Neocloeon triangulifer]|uniref:uncharacterized protein LOC132193548 n=1 Tax=Neocloeon triangulifer TaxID=2078957 RepID=UPI00286F81E5|nr:uncharacterized protein LOC132193548 [Neocloeon triangulifer]
MAGIAGNNVQRLLKTEGLEDETVVILRTPQLPSVDTLLDLTIAELFLALKMNGRRDAKIQWGKIRLATSLRTLLIGINRVDLETKFPCMNCNLRKAEYLYEICRHFGLCAQCRENRLDLDVWHTGDQREAFCQVCHQKHRSEQISKVNVIIKDEHIHLFV